MVRNNATRKYVDDEPEDVPEDCHMITVEKPVEKASRASRIKATVIYLLKEMICLLFMFFMGMLAGQVGLIVLQNYFPSALQYRHHQCQIVVTETNTVAGSSAQTWYTT